MEKINPKLVISQFNTKIESIRGNKNILTIGFISVVFIVALCLRYRLIPGVNGDISIYVGPWYDHLKSNGFSGFKDNFANYNFPYLFLLYIGTLLPIGKIAAIKLISIAFDILLAYASYSLIKSISGNVKRSVLAGISVLFIPTVFINSAYWGQTDAIYVSFLLLCLSQIIQKKFRWAWVLFGVAISFKLQAVFLLPVLFYVWYGKRGNWYDPLYSVVTFIVLSVPPVFAGRGLVDTLSVYFRQYGYEPLLSANMPNFYYFVPPGYFSSFNAAGVLFALGVVALLTYIATATMKYNKINLLHLTLIFSLLVPFVLPQMHDWYFYLFEIVSFLMCFFDKRFFFVFATIQFVTLNVYIKTLLGGKEVPFALLSLFVYILVVWIFYNFLSAIEINKNQHSPIRRKRE